MRKAPHRKTLPVRGLLHGIHCAAVKRSRCRVRMIIILANEKIRRIHPPGPPCFWRAGQGAVAKIAAPIPRRSGERESRGTSPSGAVCGRPPAAQADKTAISSAPEYKQPPSVILYRQTYPIPFSAVNMAEASVQTFPSGGGVSGGTQSAL